MEENKVIKINFTKKRKGAVELNDDFVIISGIKVLAHHDQDCCEDVYADFSVFEFYKKEIEKEDITGIEIKKVEDMGFIIFVNCNYYGDLKKRIGVLINCYNEQNGYYSDELDIKIYKDDEFIDEFKSEKCNLEF